MTIRLDPHVEQELERLAREKGRDVQSLVDEAIQEFLFSFSADEVTPEDVADGQEILMKEMPELPDWEDEGEGR